MAGSAGRAEGGGGETAGGHIGAGRGRGRGAGGARAGGRGTGGGAAGQAGRSSSYPQGKGRGGRPASRAPASAPLVSGLSWTVRQSGSMPGIVIAWELIPCGEGCGGGTAAVLPSLKLGTPE